LKHVGYHFENTIDLGTRGLLRPFAAFAFHVNVAGFDQPEDEYLRFFLAGRHRALISHFVFSILDLVSPAGNILDVYQETRLDT